jgi:hypothetical protein
MPLGQHANLNVAHSGARQRNISELVFGRVGIDNNGLPIGAQFNLSRPCRAEDFESRRATDLRQVEGRSWRFRKRTERRREIVKAGFPSGGPAKSLPIRLARLQSTETKRFKGGQIFHANSRKQRGRLSKLR